VLNNRCLKTTYYIEILKESVRKEFAPRQLTINTCDDLSLDILSRTSEYISASTLKRVFDFVARKSAISNTTLNILSDYVGYNNWERFCRSQDDPNPNLKEYYIPDTMGLKLFEIGLKNHDFATIIDYLKLIPIISVEEEDVVGGFSIGNVFSNVFKRDNVARDALLPKLAMFEQGRYYFYENSEGIKYLSENYVKGLVDYKKYINHNDRLLFKRDFIFANVLEILNSTRLNKKRLAVKQAHKLIKTIRPEDVNLESIGYHFPIARYHATHLVYLYLSKQLTKQAINSIISFISSLVNPLNIVDTNTFIIGEMFRALLYAERYHEIVDLYEHYSQSDIEFNHPSTFYTPLMKAVQISYNKLGRAWQFEDKNPSFILHSDMK
jgi:hypothetical protein